MVSASKLTLILSVSAAHYASAFTSAPVTNNGMTSKIPETQLDMFGKAFANDDSLGKRKNEGLKNVSDDILYVLLECILLAVIISCTMYSQIIPHLQLKGPKVSEVTVNGRAVKAVAGQKVSQVLASARVKMTYR